MIIIASDEKKYVLDKFKHISNKKIKVEHIEICDIIINNFLIERKQINDLYSSILDGRLFKQMEKMKNFIGDSKDYVGILLIEGKRLKPSLAKYKKMFSINEIIMSVMETYNILTILTNNIEETVKLAVDIDNYSSCSRSIIRNARGYKRKKQLKDKKKFVLMGFPTIGSKRADSILHNYKTLMEYFEHASKNGNKQIKEVLNK